MRVETMPVVGFRQRVPRPVRRLEIGEYDPRLFITLGGVAPHIKVAKAASRVGATRTLKPRMLVGSMIEHQLSDDAHPAFVRFLQENLKVVDVTALRVNT